MLIEINFEEDSNKIINKKPSEINFKFIHFKGVVSF